MYILNKTLLKHNLISDHVCFDDDAFQCDTGHCINKALKCDQKRDCLDDTSDEKDCPPVYPDGRYCPKDVYQCTTHVSIFFYYYIYLFHKRILVN